MASPPYGQWWLEFFIVFVVLSSQLRRALLFFKSHPHRHDPLFRQLQLSRSFLMFYPLIQELSLNSGMGTPSLPERCHRCTCSRPVPCSSCSFIWISWIDFGCYLVFISDWWTVNKHVPVTSPAWLIQLRCCRTASCWWGHCPSLHRGQPHLLACSPSRSSLALAALWQKLYWISWVSQPHRRQLREFSWINNQKGASLITWKVNSLNPSFLLTTHVQVTTTTISFLGSLSSAFFSKFTTLF